MANWDVPSEFFWRGLDGSQVAAFWLPQGYALAFGSPAGQLLASDQLPATPNTSSV